MRAAVLRAHGTPQIQDLPVPEADSALLRVRVIAAPINNFDRLIAAEGHPMSYTGFPVVAGNDGVGRTDDGRLVFFDAPRRPHGSLADWTLVDESRVFPLDENADAVVSAASGNLALAGWLPLVWNQEPLRGRAVAILGAAGVVGSVAVQAARHLGAHVTAVVRGARQERAARLAGADRVIDSELSPTQSDLTDVMTREGAPFDLIIDYVWGLTAAAAVRASAPGSRLVHIGSAGEDTSDISSLVVRNRGLVLSGFSARFIPVEAREAGYRDFVKLVTGGAIRLDLRTIGLEGVPEAWNQRNGAQRVVVTM